MLCCPSTALTCESLLSPSDLLLLTPSAVFRFVADAGFLPHSFPQPLLRVVETPHPYARLHAAAAEEAAATWANSRGLRMDQQQQQPQHFFYAYHISFPTASHLLLLFDPKSQTEGPQDALTVRKPPSPVSLSVCLCRFVCVSLCLYICMSLAVSLFLLVLVVAFTS